MAEYKSKGQSNYGWSLTWDAAGRYPMVAKRRFQTLADAQAFVDDTSSTATATEGLVIAVLNDTNAKNNGIYYISKVANTDPEYGPLYDKGELIKAGSGNGSMSVATLTVNSGNVAEATAENIGQIIYVTTGTETYPAGPYIVTGAGTVSKIGTTTATGDIAGDVETLKTEVSGIKNDIKTNYVNKNEVSTTGANKVVKTNSSGNIEAPAVNLSSAPVISNEKENSTDAENDTIQVVVGGKTSNKIKVHYAENTEWDGIRNKPNSLSGFGVESEVNDKLSVKADKSTVEALSDNVDDLSSTKANNTDLAALTKTTQAAALGVKLNYPELINMSEPSFILDYNIYSETSEVISVSKVEVLNIDKQLLSVNEETECNGSIEVTFAANLETHDLIFRVTLATNKTKDYIFTVKYHADGMAIGKCSGNFSTFPNQNNSIPVGFRKTCDNNIFVGDLNFLETGGSYLAVKVPNGIDFKCLKSNGFIIPMTLDETSTDPNFKYYISDSQLKTGIIENVEIGCIL